MRKIQEDGNANTYIKHAQNDLSNQKSIAVAVIASLFNVFERQVHKWLLLFRRGGGGGEMKECAENAFTICVNIFEMMEGKIIQTYCLSNDAMLNHPGLFQPADAAGVTESWLSSLFAQKVLLFAGLL